MIVVNNDSYPDSKWLVLVNRVASSLITAEAGGVCGSVPFHGPPLIPLHAAIMLYNWFHDLFLASPKEFNAADLV